MQRTLDLWLLFAAGFAVFVSVLVWRAALQIRFLRRRLDEAGVFGPPAQESLETETVAAESDWVPRR
jgi:hypothetical protein